MNRNAFRMVGRGGHVRFVSDHDGALQLVGALLLVVGHDPIFEPKVPSRGQP